MVSTVGMVSCKDKNAPEEEKGRSQSQQQVEAVKTVSDLNMPATGEVLELNEELEAHPELVNEDPYGKGWMVRIRLTDPSELDKLMNAAAYEASIH